MEKLNGLDLFSGIGGITKALEDWVQPVAYCENDRYAMGVLLSRMAEGSLPTAPIHDDIRFLEGEDVPAVDVIYGGFPCQDISVANTSGKGLEGKRSGLFFEIERLVREIRPSFLFLENVPAIRTRGGSLVGARLADAGYDCRWITLSAREIGANHQRKRWFLLAYTRCKSKGSEKESLQGAKIMFQSGRCSESGIRERPIKSPVCGVAYDVPFRVDRLRALGNAVVPAQAREAFKILMGL